MNTTNNIFFPILLLTLIILSSCTPDDSSEDKEVPIEITNFLSTTSSNYGRDIFYIDEHIYVGTYINGSNAIVKYDTLGTSLDTFETGRKKVVSSYYEDYFLTTGDFASNSQPLLCHNLNGNTIWTNESIFNDIVGKHQNYMADISYNHLSIAVAGNFDIDTLWGGANMNWNGFLCLLDENGSEKWLTNIGGTGFDFIHTICNNGESGFYLAGITDSKGAGGFDGLVVKVNNLGEILWEKTIGGSRNEMILKVITTTDSNLLLLGRSEESGDAKNLLVKMNLDGEILWQKIIGTTRVSEIEKGLGSEENKAGLIEAYDGNFLMVSGAYIRKVSPQGEIIWERFIGSDNTSIRDISAANSTNYIITGNQNPYASAENYNHGFIMLLDWDGNKIW